MSKKTRRPGDVIRELFTSAFFKYHLNKMSLAEFLIRFVRIDVVSNGSTPENQELLKLLRNHQRGIINCDCPFEAPSQMSFKEYLKQRKIEKKSK